MLNGGAEIRDAEISDLPHLFSLLKALHGSPPWDEESDQDRAHSALRDILGTQYRSLMIATYNGIPVGSLDLLVVRNLTRNISPWSAVENIVVLPEYRRRGIGKMLLESAIGKAKEAGCYKIQLVSATRRDAAHALYESTGFDADVSGFRRYLIDP